MEELFRNEKINFQILKERGVSMRWGEVEDGTIPLTAADTDFAPPQEILDDICAYTQGAYFPYVSALGISGLNDSIAKRTKERIGVTVNPNWIVNIDSAARGMELIARTCLKPGDEAIIFDPVDLLFGISTRMAGGNVIYYPCHYKNGKWDFSDLEEYITNRTKMLCICNPHNPLGVLYSKEELSILLDIANKYHLSILNDEIWSDIIYSERKFVSITSLGEERNKNTYTVYGFSKGFALPGMKAGYVICQSKEAYDMLVDTMGTSASANILAQVAMKSAFDKCYPWTDAFVKHLQGNRDYVYERLSKMKNVVVTKQEATFVSFPDISQTGLSGDEFVDLCRNKFKLSLVPGNKKWFGPRASGHVRICYATSNEILEEGLNRFQKCVESIRE